MTVNLPPNTGEAELDNWTYEVTQDLNTEIASVVTVDPETGGPAIDGIFLGYSERYLDTAWGSSSIGANFTTTIGGLPAGTTTVFQGLRNSSNTVESTNPAEFTWRQIVLPTGSNTTTALPWYRTIGGRRIDWLFDTAQPTGYTQDEGTAVIDLDIIAGVSLMDGISTRVDLAYGETSTGATSEIQTITATGTRSNVVGSSGGSNEFLRISLSDNFNGGTTPNATFSFDPDTANTVYSSSITNMSLAANIGNEPALTAIGTAIAALESNITWDLMQGTESASGSSLLTLTFPDGAASGTNAIFIAGPAGGNPPNIVTNQSTGALRAAQFEGALNTGYSADSTISVSRTSNVVTLTSTGSDIRFVATATSSATTFEYAGYRSVVPTATQTVDGVTTTVSVATGQPALVVSGPTGSRYIDIDLGTTTDIMASLTIAASGTGAASTTPTLTATDGVPGSSTGVQTTYTVTDYDAREVTSFTSFVTSTSGSDITTVLSSIETAVDSNTETPIDFTASVSGSVITFTASTAGAITGLWSVAVNNNGQTTDAGNIAFGTAVVTQAGGTTIANPQYASGTFTVGNYVQATPLTTSTLIAERTISWTTTEPVVSTTDTDYQFRPFVGPRNANGFVYMAATVAPSAPTQNSGSINFTTGVFTAPSGWSNDAPASTTAGERIYVTHWVAAEVAFDGAVVITYQTPVLSQIVVNDVKSINYDGTTSPGANDRYIDTGATQGYFLDGDTGQLITTDVIAKDFDVSSNNIRLGPDAGNPTAITGVNNTSAGMQAGEGLTTGTNNVLIGNNAGTKFATSTGSRVVAPLTGVRNTVVGVSAMGGLITTTPVTVAASDNTAIGNSALSSITSGSNNSVLGVLSGLFVTTGSDNVMLGTASGSTTTTGDQNILIGRLATASSATASNEIVIGATTDTVARVGAYDLATLSGRDGSAFFAYADNVVQVDAVYPTTGGFALTDIGSVSLPSPLREIWPTTGTINGIPSLTYTPGDGVPGDLENTAPNASLGTLANNTGSDITVLRMDVTVTVLDTLGVCAINFGQSSVVPANDLLFNAILTGLAPGVHTVQATRTRTAAFFAGATLNFSFSNNTPIVSNSVFINSVEMSTTTSQFVPTSASSTTVTNFQVQPQSTSKYQGTFNGFEPAGSTNAAVYTWRNFANTDSWFINENSSGDLTITLKSDTTKGMKLDSSGNLTITGTLTQSGTL